MDFKLNPEIMENIIFCMENQKDVFFFDIKQKRCVSASESGEMERENLIPLPEWTPVHGFRLMEEFTGTVKNPVIREKLRETISVRTGVFKRFRQILSGYPEFDQAWRFFKKDRLKKTVYNWYQTISLAKELSDLGEEPEETYEIIRNDFIFGSCKPSSGFLKSQCRPFSGAEPETVSKNTALPEKIIEEGFSEVLEKIPETSRQAAANLFLRFISGNPGNMEIFYAETPAAEKAGAVLVEYFSGKGNGKTAVVTAAAVKMEFRGLGVFTQLLETVKSSAEKKSYRAMCFMPFTSPFLNPLLERLEMTPDLPAEPAESLFF